MKLPGPAPILAGLVLGAALAVFTPASPAAAGVPVAITGRVDVLLLAARGEEERGSEKGERLRLHDNSKASGVWPFGPTGWFLNTR